MNPKNLRIPQRIRQGIKPLKRTLKENTYIIGTDSESYEGVPITFQFYCPELNIEKIDFIKTKRPSTVFLDFLNSLPKNDADYLIFGHNLKFDGLAFFYDYAKELTKQRFEFGVEDWEISGVYSNLVFFRFKRDKHQNIRLLDTFAFYKGSLAKMAGLHCSWLPKMNRPPRLGRKLFTENDQYFKDYAMVDAKIAYYTGKNIIELHRKMEVQTAVSIADFSSKVFRKHFLEKPIPFPGGRISRISYKSYHGGKNLLRCKPGIYENVTALDIVSAYPHAMTELPDFSDMRSYYYIPPTNNPETPPEWGVYKISGEIRNCTYPILYDHDFKPVYNEIENIWVSGYELIEALRSKELNLKKLEGFCYCPKELGYLPLKTFSNHYFKLKDTEKDPILRYSYKLILNSLSGKFVQTVKENAEENKVYDDKGNCLNEPKIIAGGLFNPFIASLITGHTRAKIHRLEHKFKSIHTSTDGIFTLEKVHKKHLTKGLGGLKIETEGRVLIMRNKLYIFWDKDGNVKKYALHGFRGTVRNLVKLWNSGKSEYAYTRCNTLKDALKRNLVPNKFDVYKARVNYG